MRLRARLARLEKQRGVTCPACGRASSEGQRVRLEFVIDGVVSGPAPGRCPACDKGVVYRVVVE